VNAFLTEKCFPLMKDGEGEDLRRKFSRLINATSWLKAARDSSSMHYATFEQWKSVLPIMDQHKMGFEFVMGEVVGNTFYSTADSAANISLYLTVNEDWQAGLKVLSAEAKKLSGALGELIRACLNAYFEAHWDNPCRRKDKLQRKTAAKFDREPMDGFYLPYFFDLG
jgi:hypothetical protein